ncbi:MAG: acetyl-CoA carboxylase biotin carboxylase subunit [Verrucomicrobia bacterium]|nr:acetyl-CoA carboxylase biotin carboxylase subunit [Verrucomicrobiota bacterium]
MFERILIANRGEIALRIIRACKELGIQTVAVYSRADERSLHVQLADSAICIGNSASAESYLHVPSIIKAAEIFDVEAIHPGYGFLAEDAHFAEICESCRVKFIGPHPEVIRRMGDKAEAIRAARSAGVPVIPGSEGIVADKAEALKVVEKIKYPVIIKAAAGGGGRGMRVAHTDVALTSALQTAQAEAEAAFGNPAVYIEKYLENPRHIEIQVLADTRGNAVHLGERDCSVQRRHQKLIEEAPSPAITPSIRRAMTKATLKLVQEVGYVNAGTIEFLLDKDSDFYFIEMNTRIQVEHTVTEMVYGVDLVKEQIRIAAGERLSLDQRSIRPNGHAIECRINAEDPADRFRPCPGTIEFCSMPGGPNVRVDSHIYSGYTVPPHYDSLLAKLLAWGRDRREAIGTMRRALDEFYVNGIATTVPFHKHVMHHPKFVSGAFGNHFVDEVVRDQGWA